MDKPLLDLYKTRMTDLLQRTIFPENHHYVPDVNWVSSAFTVVRAGKAATTRDHRIERLEFPGQDILYCVSGRGSVLSEGRVQTVEPGQLAWLTNEEPHGHWPDDLDPWTVLFARIDGPNCPMVRRKLFGSAATVTSVAVPRAMEMWFDRLFEVLRLRDDHVDIALNKLVAEMLEMVSGTSTMVGAARYPEPLRAILAGIREEPSRAWDAEELSSLSGLSAAQTRRLFQKHLQVSPRRWLIRERIMKAQRLLLDTAMTVSSVAETCGFYDVYHFSREFKRSTGTSPAAWRKSDGH